MRWMGFAGVIAGLVVTSPLVAQDSSFVRGPGNRPGFTVDGKPFLVLGIQLNNSSGTPAMLRDLAPAIRRSAANVVMAPIGWESIEPEEGRFDFKLVDGMIAEARAEASADPAVVWDVEERDDVVHPALGEAR